MIDADDKRVLLCTREYHWSAIIAFIIVQKKNLRSN